MKKFQIGLILSFGLLIPIGFINVYCAIFYGLFLVILLLNREKIQNYNENKVPFWLWLMLFVTSLFVIFIDISILLFVSGMLMLLCSEYLYNKGSLPKKTRLFSILSVLLIVILGVVLLDIPKNMVRSADFTDFRSERLTYYQYDQSDISKNNYVYSQGKNGLIFKSLSFYGIHTSEWENHTSEKLDFNATIDHTAYLDDNTYFWNVRTDIVVITLNEYTRTFLDTGLTAYPLLSKMYSLKEYLTSHNAVFYNLTSNGYLTSFSLPNIAQGSYLIAVDFTIDSTTAYNNALYTLKDPPKSFTALCRFYFEDQLFNATSEGWSWNYYNLEPISEAENLFGDFMSKEELNLIGVFLLVYFVCIIIAFVQRNMNILFIIQILLFCLMILAVFALMSNAMEFPPRWIISLAGEKNGTYMWGVFQGVKSGIIFAVIGVVMGNLTQFLTSSVGLLFSSGGITQIISSNMDSQPSKKKKTIAFSNKIDIDKILRED